VVRGALFTLAVAVALVAHAAHPTSAASGLTGLAGLKVAYDAMLNARFDRADEALRRACGPAPREACEVIGATSLWWQILLDPRDTSRDAAFQKKVNDAIELCERWVLREPDRAEAWFYLGGAYGARVSWRVERGARLSAARDGKRIKEALERALVLDPSLQDARFGIGLYKYYADIAPTAAKIFRFLLLLPGGDKVAGLRDMQATESRGQLVAGEALYQLHWIYFWYEQQPQRGLEALERLAADYPSNPHFLQRIGQVQVEYLHDAGRSLAAWQRLVAGAADSGDPTLAEVLGRIGAAEQFDALADTDLGVAEAQRVLAMAPARPVGSLGRAQVLLGRMLDRLGHRTEAVAAYRAAAAAPVPAGDPDRVRPQAREGLARVPDPVEAEGYRVGLSGWRAFERGEMKSAMTQLTRARSLTPLDAVIRVRLARVTARTQPDHALAEFEAVIAARPLVTPIALTAAYAWSADLLAARGSRAQAVDRYRAATRVFAGDSRLAEAARQSLIRMGEK